MNIEDQENKTSIVMVNNDTPTVPPFSTEQEEAALNSGPHGVEGAILRCGSGELHNTAKFSEPGFGVVK